MGSVGGLYRLRRRRCVGRGRAAVVTLANCADCPKMPEYSRRAGYGETMKGRAMRRDVRGRVVLVTGASRGIGRRVASRLAQRGARLALTARSAEDLTKVVDEARAAGAQAEAFPGDLTKPDDRERIVSGTVARFGQLDVLLNCA